MRIKLMTVAAALLSLIATGHAWSAEQTPLGLWQAVDDDTKQPSGWFLISEHDGVYAGIIAKMFLKPGEDPNALCEQVQGRPSQSSVAGPRDHPRHEAGERQTNIGGGTILDPRDGKIYKATMTVTPDGQTLVVRGYLGFELLGQQSILDAVAGFRLQRARSVDQSQCQAAGGRANHRRAAGRKTRLRQ